MDLKVGVPKVEWKSTALRVESAAEAAPALRDLVWVRNFEKPDRSRRDLLHQLVPVPSCQPRYRHPSRCLAQGIVKLNQRHPEFLPLDLPQSCRGEPMPWRRPMTMPEIVDG